MVKKSRVLRVVAAVAAPAAVLAAGAMVLQASNAAFSADARNAGNNWDTGQVAITTDSGGTAMFQVTNMIPEQTGQHCITVSTSSSNPGVVKMYLINPEVATHPALASHLKLTVVQGDVPPTVNGGSFASCSGFVAGTTLVNNEALGTLVTSHSDWATAVGTWAPPAGPQSLTYKFSWVLDTTGMTQAEIDALQNTNVGTDFEWELQNS